MSIRFIPQKVTVMNAGEGEEMMRRIESAARTCYRSERYIKDKSYEPMLRHLIRAGHEAPLEFGQMSFEIVTSRSVLAELTRHRLASFCVESQRYCNYEEHIDFIQPEWFEYAEADIPKRTLFQTRRLFVEGLLHMIHEEYREMIEEGFRPEDAREILPNATAVRLKLSMNYRELRHFLKLRTSKAAYPPMRELAVAMMYLAAKEAPVVFEDIVEQYERENPELE